MQVKKKTARGGQLLGYLTVRGKLFSLCESGTVVPLLRNAASAPWRPSHTGTSMLHTKSSQATEIWRVVATTDVGNVTQGYGFLDSQMLPISGAQYVWAFCYLLP